MWLVIALISYAFAAVVSVLDKFILTNEKVSPLRFVFYSTIFVVPIFILIPWTKMPVNYFEWLGAFLTGVSFAFGLWTMYLGIQKSEISHIGPLIGGTIPLFILFLSWWFLGELISDRQLWAVILLALGSLLISSEYTNKKQGLHKAIFWGVLAAFLFAMSHTATKYLYNEMGFFSGFVWGRSFTGIFGICLLFIPGFLESIVNEKKIYSRVKISLGKLTLIAINKILAVISLLLIQYAIYLGSVTIVNALAGVQYAFLLILVGVLSKFYPQRFREEYSHAEIVQEILSVIIISVGLYLLL